MSRPPPSSGPGLTQRRMIRALHAKNNKGKPNAEAVKTFDRNNGRQTADEGPTGAGKQAGDRNQAGDGNQAGARKQTGVANQAGAEKARSAEPPSRRIVRTRRRKPIGVRKNNGSVCRSLNTGETVQSSQQKGRHARRRRAACTTSSASTAGESQAGAARGWPWGSCQRPAARQKKKKKHGEEG